MEAQELLELPEKVHRSLERRIGVTMALMAALLASVTLMGHRLHTEEVVLQTRLADQWAYYQAKNTRAQMYANDAAMVALQGATGAALAADWRDKAEQEREQADAIRRHNDDLDHETERAATRATMFDRSEVFLEIGIVLCSIALLTGGVRFWFGSFVIAAAGVALGAAGFLL